MTEEDKYDSIEDTAMSYTDWKENGFYVKKGSKSRIRDALGAPQFCVDQVISYEPEGKRFIREELEKIPKEELDLYNIQTSTPKSTPTPSGCAKKYGSGIPDMAGEFFNSILAVEFKHHGHLVGNLEYDEHMY